MVFFDQWFWALSDQRIIFSRNLNHERKIFPSVGCFFLWNLPFRSEHVYVFFQKFLKCSYGLVECILYHSGRQIFAAIPKIF